MNNRLNIKWAQREWKEVQEQHTDKVELAKWLCDAVHDDSISKQGWLYLEKELVYFYLDNKVLIDNELEGSLPLKYIRTVYNSCIPDTEGGQYRWSS